MEVFKPFEPETQPDDDEPAHGEAGTWRNEEMINTRTKYPVVHSILHRRGASLYSIRCDEDLDQRMRELRGPYLPNVANLDKYRRYRVFVPKSFPTCETSFADGTYLYYVAMNKAGQHLVARSYLGLLHKIKRLYFTKLRSHPTDFNLTKPCLDDFFRKHLKIISAWAFQHVFQDGPAYMFFMHGDMLGGHAPWTVEQVLSDITSWVSGEDEGNLEVLKPYMDSIFGLWPSEKSGRHKLSFDEFCSDPLRWGTSGGAKKAAIDGSEYRSKWAWAWSRLIKDGRYEKRNLYEDALQEGNICVVALKEEEKKTREIITTPMASYLRQSYLAYRWGNLPGDTPLSQPRWLGDFQSTRYSWYGCADADRFDHSVSKEMVVYVLSRLGEADEECARVARDEIDSLEGLKLTWNKYEWDYKGGLLSGWRLTSMIGTLMSLAIGRFIIDDLGLTGAHAIGMGDDIMIASPTLAATRQQLYDSYAKTGFKVNLLKTTTGPIGEFLRQTYSDRGVFGYPANGLSAVIYSPPWLARYDLEKEQEISKNWLTFYSRLLPHCLDTHDLTKFIQARITEAVRDASRIKGPLRDWLHTPISAGGGGPMEWSNPKVWSSIVITFPSLDNSESFMTLFGITSKNTKSTIGASKHISKIDMSAVKHDCVNLNRITMTDKIHIPSYVNKTDAIVGWFFDKTKTKVSELESVLRIRIPRGLHGTRKLGIVKYLLGVERTATGFCSVQTTVAATGHYQQRMATLTRVASSNRRLFTAKNLPAVATAYASQLFSDVKFVSGTW